MKKYIVLGVCILILLIIIQNGKKNPTKDVPLPDTKKEVVSPAFGEDTKVTIKGYDDDAMEPFISKDGQYLFWNSLNDGKHTSLYYAKKIDATTFEFIGEVKGVNGQVPHLDGVASMDDNNNFYFVSLRDYPKVFENLQHGTFRDGVVSDLTPVQGDMYKKEAGWLIMDAEISRDGKSLYYVDAHFDGGPVPVVADIAVAHKEGSSFTKDSRSSSIFKNINTTDKEYAPSVSANGLEIIFTRLSGRTTTIHRATRGSLDEPFGIPQLVPTGGTLPEGSTISTDGTNMYYHKKDGAHYKIFSLRRI